MEVSEGLSNTRISEVVELSIDFMVGLSSPKTEGQGHNAQQDVVMMIYCGVTHNFIIAAGNSVGGHQ